MYPFSEKHHSSGEEQFKEEQELLSNIQSNLTRLKSSFPTLFRESVINKNIETLLEAFSDVKGLPKDNPALTDIYRRRISVFYLGMVLLELESFKKSGEKILFIHEYDREDALDFFVTYLIGPTYASA